MTTILTREQWGARPAVGDGNALQATPLGAAIHWEGPAMGSRPHTECGALVRGIQAFHQNSRGWADIAYNLLVCEHGVIFVGRGRGKGSAANGTTAANLAWYAICALVGKGDPITQALRDGLNAAVRLVQSWGAQDGVTGHRDHFQTECPGADLYADLKDGQFGRAAVVVAPRPPASPIPAPLGKAPAFPLPRGWYFGPSTGPKASVSGYYGFRDDLRVWQNRMAKRDWRIVADGLYGPRTAAVAKAFQAEKGLTADGLIGAATWAAAWNEAVTR